MGAVSSIKHAQTDLAVTPTWGHSKVANHGLWAVRSWLFTLFLLAQLLPSACTKEKLADMANNWVGKKVNTLVFSQNGISATLQATNHSLLATRKNLLDVAANTDIKLLVNGELIDLYYGGEWACIYEDDGYLPLPGSNTLEANSDRQHEYQLRDMTLENEYWTQAIWAGDTIQFMVNTQPHGGEEGFREGSRSKDFIVVPEN